MASRRSNRISALVGVIIKKNKTPRMTGVTIRFINNPKGFGDINKLVDIYRSDSGHSAKELDGHWPVVATDPTHDRLRLGRQVGQQLPIIGSHEVRAIRRIDIDSFPKPPLTFPVYESVFQSG